MARRPQPGQAGKPARVITPELVRSALGCIPPDVDRDTWVRLGMAVKAELGAEGFDLWDAWSQGATGYRAADARDVWKGIKAGGRVTIGTLFGIAKGHGFKFPDDDSAGLSPEALAEQARQHERRQAAKAAADAAEAEQYRQRADKAARDAVALWADAADATESGASPYLVRKAVQAHGVRVMRGRGRDDEGTLLVPLRNAAGELLNVQRIAPRKPTEAEHAAGKREKRFLPGGRKKGLFHVIPARAADLPAVCQPEGAAIDLVLMAEGYATAATLHEASGRAAVVGFDAGNLAAVAEAMPARFPGCRFLVCGDDDAATGTGRKGAEAAARKLQALGCAAAVLLPQWPDEPGSRPEGASDFNDLAACAGLAEVTRQLAAAADAPTLEPAPRTRKPRQAAKTAAGGPNAGAAGPGHGGDTPGASAGSEGVSQFDGDGDGRSGSADARTAGTPGTPGTRDPFRLDDDGVWFVRQTQDGERADWVCAPLQVQARTRDDTANGWGYLLNFTDPDGNPKAWAMPVAMLSGEGAEWAARLADMGLEIAHGPAARNRVGQYIKTRHPAERVTCTDRVGWHGGVYVLPSGCIGEGEGPDGSKARFVFQSDASMPDTFRQRGDLAQWRTGVAWPCEGNSRFLFAVSCAFAGALLLPAGVEGGGFHFRSGSSQGKTSALKIAASVWGRADYVKTWRTTDNAIEATAAQHSDGLLILDEIGQLDAAKAGECAYMLANGQAKGRGSRNGSNRKQATWRVLFLSSGEVNLSALMAEAGKRAMAGQEVRMAEVPMDAGQGMGAVEDLRGHATAGELVDAIVSAAGKHYGTPGRTWLQWLCDNRAGLADRLARDVEAQRALLLPKGGGEQVRRVANRFALVAVAGELASEAGITGWPAGAATRAVRQCFDAWLDARGHAGNGEEFAMLAQVKAFIGAHADSRMTWLHRTHDDHRPNTPLRVGFKRLVGEDGKPLKLDAANAYMDKHSTPESSEKFNAETEYLFTPEAWKGDVCKGLDAKAVLDLLKRRGHLVHEKGSYMRSHRVPGLGKWKVYHLKASVLADEL